MVAQLKFEKCLNYISLHGNYINNIATIGVDSQIPDHCLINRQKRDGSKYHITIISPPEFKTLSKVKRGIGLKQKQYNKAIHSKIVKLYGKVKNWPKPIDLGMGVCQDGGSISYFKVIHWPLGQNIRKLVYDLDPLDFHITLGFQPKDVHLYKGPGTLCDLQNLSCSEERLKSLIGLVPFYKNDVIFIKALYKHCTHLNAIKQSIKLSKLCMLSKEHARS